MKAIATITEDNFGRQSHSEKWQTYRIREAARAILFDEESHIALMHVASAYNSQREDGFTASHAEMKSIAIANGKLGRKLTGITAYGNCEPCTMCLTALIFAGVERIVFARRLNDFNNDDEKINIDCFEFVKKFPKQPVIEFIEL